MMADILCPTCGKSNTDDHSFCDFCAGPIKEPEGNLPDNSSLRDEFFAPDGSQNQEAGDELSRLDSLFSDQNSEEQSSQIQEPSREQPEDDAFRLDEILPPDNQEIKPEAADLISPAEEPDDPFDLDDLLSPQEPIQDHPGESETLASKPKEDEFPLEDLFSPEEPDEAPPLDDTPQPGTETPADQESSPDSWLEQINQTDDQAPDITQPEIPGSPEKLPEDIESPYAFLDPEQPSESISQQEGETGLPETWDKVEPTFESTGFEEDSGWLDMLQDPDSRDDPSPEIDPALKDKKPQTDWLTKIKRLNKSADLVEEDSSFPDWLTVSEKPAEEPPGIEEEEPGELEETPASDLPAWLQLDEDDESLNEFLRRKDLTDDEYKPKFVTDNLPEDIPLPESYGAPEPEEDPSKPKKFPSWADGESKPEQIPDELQFLAGTDQESVPSNIVDPFQGEDEYIDDLFTDDLPEWLTTASTTEEILPFEEELSVGDLPGWVEAMRPVVESTDATGLSEDEDYIENYGPLAGIPSVLPAEADIVQDPDKADKKPIDLIASKAQQDYVNLLKKLIGEESKTKPIQKAAPIQTQRVLRWLITIILLVTTAGTIIFGGNFDNPAPRKRVSPLTGYGSMYIEIENIYNEQPVLIAHDYQPAAAGELHTAAAGVVDHLMEQGAYLTFVSTVPTGPALAEHFLANTQEDHDYRHTQQYINLGYLPGESAGLLSFIVAPKKIIPLAFDGSNAWGSPPLIEVNSIQDFAMILVITDDPNTAKIWIEQVGTILEETPLTMVVSAQVEPLIQPYFRSSPQLLTGYVAGVIDSMNYEHLIGRPNLANERWLPFNIGIIISVGTIFIGGLANGVLSLFSRHRARKIGDIK